MNHDDNVIGAAVLLIADRMRVSVDSITGRGGVQPAALTTLYRRENGSAIEELSRDLGISHSRTVRVVDGLVEDGLAERRDDPSDRRVAIVELTRAGESTATDVLEARADALGSVLAAVPPSERNGLARAAEKVLEAAVADRSDARLTCRLCDTEACGHLEGECPATRAADRAEALRGSDQR